MYQPLNLNQVLIGDTTNRPIRLLTKSTEKLHLKDPRWPCVLAVCMPYVLAMSYEPQYEVVSLRSGTNHLYNQSKLDSHPSQIQADSHPPDPSSWLTPRGWLAPARGEFPAPNSPLGPPLVLHGGFMGHWEGQKSVECIRYDFLRSGCD
jgi:hypothetical protein